MGTRPSGVPPSRGQHQRPVRPGLPILPTPQIQVRIRFDWPPLRRAKGGGVNCVDGYVFLRRVVAGGVISDSSSIVRTRKVT